MPRRHAAAFSLIELVLTTLIVGLLAAVAVPRYARASANFRLDAAARKVAADLTYAAELARTRSGTVYVAFNTVTHQVATYHFDPGPTLVTGEVTQLADTPYQVSVVSADFNGIGLVSFNGFGRPDTGGSVKLAAGGRTRTLTLDATTGEATLP